jgi:hypothetical protein
MRMCHVNQHKFPCCFFNKNVYSIQITSKWFQHTGRYTYTCDFHESLLHSTLIYNRRKRSIHRFQHGAITVFPWIEHKAFDRSCPFVSWEKIEPQNRQDASSASTVFCFFLSRRKVKIAVIVWRNGKVGFIFIKMFLWRPLAFLLCL